MMRVRVPALCLGLAVLCIATLAACSSCVDRGSGATGKKIDTAFIRAHLLEAVPAGITRFDIDVGDGAVTYVGNRVDRPRLAPGATVIVTHYWKVNRALAKEWRPFTIVRGAPNTPDFINVSPSDMQIGHPASAWKPGQVIEDPHSIVIRPDWSSPSAKVLVGFIEEGKHGPLDRIAVAGQPIEERAIVAAQLDIDLSRAPPRPGTVHIPRATSEIVIDGVASDPAWSTAAVSPEFIPAEGGGDSIGKATAKLLWDDLHLYVLVQVQDTDIFSPYKQHDELIWKADCIEIFLDADSNRRTYVELQVSPNNVTFDSWFVTRAKGDPSWNSGMKTAVKVRGNAAVAGDSGDQGWDAELAIPWEAVKGREQSMQVELPPRVGDQWRVNLVRVDKRSVGDDVQASSWNRISRTDFHALDRMLVAKFADPTGSIVPSAVPAEAASAPGAGSGSAAAPLPPEADGDAAAPPRLQLRTPSGSGSGSGSGSATP